MKLFFRALIFPVLLFGAITITEAQKSSGTVVNKPTDSQKPKNTSEISKFDFKNFTYPIPDIGMPEKSVTLKNGSQAAKNGLPNFKLRKTYYFDLTGDRADEAITQIIADGCQIGCESSSLFYVHTLENGKPALIWKIAIAGDIMGGLKSAHFNVKEFTIETFGDCTLDDWKIKTNLDLKNNQKIIAYHYSRFVFTYENGAFSSGTKILLPLENNLNMAGYRPKISFGEPE